MVTFDSKGTNMVHFFMVYLTLIADIIDSKELPRRGEVQDRLALSLKNISDRTLLSPFTMALGDEFQSVYKNGDTVILHIIQLLAEMYPIRIRFALGIGTLLTELNREMAIGMDGPAFHMARKGMGELKKKDYSIIQVYGGDFRKSHYLNESLNLAMALLGGLKKNNLLTLNALLVGKSVEEISDELDISVRGVYKNIKTNRLLEFKNTFLAAGDIINQLMEHGW
jgi:DNA-binding CsgD family transcriptional regulator